MARECNEYIHTFLKRQINFTNSTACSGFPDVLRIAMWCSQCMAREGLVNKLFLVGRIDSARIGSHHDVITDLADLEELSPYKTLI